jgi:hypothetical protein
MKKILVNLALFVAVTATYGQQPVHIYTPHLMAPGNWYMVGTWDSTNACYADTLGFFLEGDTVNIWSNKFLNIQAFNNINFWKLTGDKLEPKVATNYVNTANSYYIDGINVLKYDTSLYNTIVGGYALYSNTTGLGNTSIGGASAYSNTTGGYNTSIGYASLAGNTTGKYNTAIGLQSLSINSTTDSNNIAIGYKSGYTAHLSNRLWIGQGDSNAAIIYGEMLTRPRIRINGELFATTIKTTITSDTLTDGVPTEAEINAALGLTPATATRGATYIIQDADGTLLIYDVISDGRGWFYTVRTKAL